MSKAPAKNQPATFKMIQSLSLRSTGRSVHMNTVVTPINEAEEAELMEFTKGPRPVCRQLVGAEAPAVAADDDKGASTGADTQGSGGSAPDATSDLLEVPGVGKKSFESLNGLGIKTAEDLKNAVQDAEKYAAIEKAVGAPNAAKWKTHFAPANAGASDDQGAALPRSSREEPKK